MLALLAEADRLTALAELVGAAAMPGSERMVMLAGRLLRDGVLRQSATSSNDGSCSAAKGAALVEAVLAVVDRCQELVGSGVSASVLEEVDYGPLLRAPEETGPADADAVRRHGQAMLDVLDGLR